MFTDDEAFCCSTCYWVGSYKYLASHPCINLIGESQMSIEKNKKEQLVHNVIWLRGFMACLTYCGASPLSEAIENAGDVLESIEKDLEELLNVD